MFEWLTDCLRDPSGTYELITPARRPLVTSMGTIRAADLLPSVRLRVMAEETHTTSSCA